MNQYITTTNTNNIKWIHQPKMVDNVIRCTELQKSNKIPDELSL